METVLITVILATLQGLTPSFVMAAASSESLVLHISLEDGSNTVFVGEKTIVNVTVQFTSEVYDDVIIDVHPQIVTSDVLITKVKKIEIGSNLLITGSTEPLLDFGRPELQVPGKALPFKFHLGKVMRSRKTKPASGQLALDDVIVKPASDDDVVLIQYEVLIPEEYTVGTAEIGINQVTVCTDKMIYIQDEQVMVTTRNLPKFAVGQAGNAHEMFLDKTAPLRK